MRDPKRAAEEAVISSRRVGMGRMLCPRADGCKALVHCAGDSEIVSEYSGTPTCKAAARAWQMIDWLPARLTALGFAVVGSFEDAVDNWRRYESLPQSEESGGNDGLIVAATAGAINVRLGSTTMAQGESQAEMPAASALHEPQLAHLRSIVGLVWRSVVMWLLLLALLTLARLIG